jgi:uncharacterized membrane-anchored protein YhcB (DUF1043 family)
MKNLVAGMVIGLTVGLAAGAIKIRKINNHDTNEWVKQEMEKSKMAIKIDVMTKRQEKLEAKITELKADRDMLHMEYAKITKEKDEYIEELEKGQ